MRSSQGVLPPLPGSQHRIRNMEDHYPLPWAGNSGETFLSIDAPAEVQPGVFLEDLLVSSSLAVSFLRYHYI